MSAYLVVVRPRIPEVVRDHPLIAAAAALQIQVGGIAEERRYVLGGDLDAHAVAHLAGELLVDPVTSEAVVASLEEELPTVQDGRPRMDWAVDVAYRPGVTDNE